MSLKHPIALVLFLLLLPFSLGAQQRFCDSLFQAVEKTTHTFFQRDSTQLLLDFYQPADDPVTQRPVLLYVHGGGFAGGRRDEKLHDIFLRNMASRGYATATIDYTLWMKGQSFSCDQPTSNKILTFRKTALDIHRATAYLLSQQEAFGIDPTKIVLMGSSAGAEAILHAAYWEVSRMEGERPVLPPAFQYAGVISLAGALISPDLITEENAIATQLFHGTCDNLVPYGAAPHHYCAPTEPGYLQLHGGRAIADRLAELGKSYFLVSVCRGRHEWAAQPMITHREAIADFLYHDVVLGDQRQIHLIESSDQAPCPDNYPSFNHCD